MPDGIRWVGLDVHARESTFAIFDQDSGEVTTKRVMGRPHELLPWLRGVERPARMVYEAGPTGYGLARRALAEGIELAVCAPSKTERPSDRVKTDQRDAVRLATNRARTSAGIGGTAEDRVRPHAGVCRVRAGHVLCRYLERRRRRYRARPPCVNARVAAGPTSARESPIVHERGVRELARAFTRRRSVAGPEPPTVELAANQVSVLLVSSG